MLGTGRDVLARGEQGLASNVEQLSMDIDEAKVAAFIPSSPPRPPRSHTPSPRAQRLLRGQGTETLLQLRFESARLRHVIRLLDDVSAPLSPFPATRNLPPGPPRRLRSPGLLADRAQRLQRAAA